MLSSDIQFDLEQARRNLSNEESLVIELANIFISDVPGIAERLANTHRDSASPSRERDARRIAHDLKSLAMNFYAQPLSQIAESIENSPAAWLSNNDPESPEALTRLAKESSKALARALAISR